MDDLLSGLGKASGVMFGSSSRAATAAEKAKEREEKLMEMETDLNVILQKKKDDGDGSSSSSAIGSGGSSNVGLLALIACAGLAAWFLLMKLPQSMPSPAAQAQMMMQLHDRWCDVHPAHTHAHTS